MSKTWKTILIVAGAVAILGAGFVIGRQAVTKTVNFTVSVTEPQDFSVVISPASLALNRGQVGTFNITTSASGGYEGDVDLTVVGLPAGTYSLSATRIAVGQSATLTINATLPVGQYAASLSATEVADQPPFNTIRSASAGSADIQAAIDAAQDGWTVVVPAGDTAWTSNVTIPATKGIRLMGAGAELTRIDLANAYALYVYPREETEPIRISGFGFRNCPAPSLQINDYTVGSTDWRVDHCTWTGGALGTQVNVHGHTFGVIDNCRFENCLRALWIDGQVRPFDITAPMPYPGGYSWTRPITPGGPDAVYIEDCVIANTTASIFFNCRGGARFVMRRNTITGANGLETHSGCTPGYRNPRWCEIYENTFDLQGGAYWCGLFLRSTNGVIFNNSFSAGYPTVIRFDNETICLDSCTAPWPTANRTAYPAQDQIGAGRDTGWGTAQATDEAKLWIWGNTQAGAAVTPQFSSCATSAELVQQNRDYFFSAPPAYAPYAYPHPLRSL